MELAEISELLKLTAEKIDKFLKDADNTSACKMAEEYIKDNDLGYIKNEVGAAFHKGFITALRQERSGRFSKRND